MDISEARDRVVCIIPAYNEEATVANIAALTAHHPMIGKVLVVDDGSSDSTSDRAKSVPDVAVLRLEPNRGKGAAMQAGLDATTETILLFLDADLIGMNTGHITGLLEPVVKGEADMSVGLFRGGRLHTDLAHIITPSLSGQRAIRREILDNLDMESVGFGIERALTELWETKAIRVREVILQGVTHRTKEEKRGYIEGVRQRWKMYFDILKYESGKFKRKMSGAKNNDESVR